ncbi:MAG: HAD-IB family phosphatase [Candidatus Paceibacterales bacterium]
MKKKRRFLPTGYDIVVFDCDSTLAEIEGIDLLAKRLGREKEVATLTNQAMNGKINFEDVFPARLNLIKPKRKDLEWLGRQYIKHQVKDAKRVIRKLQNLGKKVYIVTAAYETPVKKFATYLGIPAENVFTVELKFGRDEEYLGYNTKNPLIKNKGKRKVLQELAKFGSLLFVGDGATDLEAKDVVDTFVGFGGAVCRPVVREKADIFINLKTLIPIVALAQGVKGK